MSRNPVAILLTDIHFTVPTLEKASAALLQAQYQACIKNLPLIICGDTLDSKSIMRAECVNQLLKLLCVIDAPETYMLVGNHDLCNERGVEHSLNFLRGAVTLVDTAREVYLGGKPVLLISYQSDQEKFKSLIQDEDRTNTIICHQGIQGANMGHYVSDKSALDPKIFGNRRVISGHYHRRQDLEGTNISYLGNPYSMNFGEANDGLKGYNILYSDGSLELVPLALPKHVIVERTPATVNDAIEGLKSCDSLMLKVTGTEEELRLLNKQEIGQRHLGHANFRLDLIPVEIEPLITEMTGVQLTESEILDSLIEILDGTEQYKTDLKDTWRGLISENPKS